MNTAEFPIHVALSTYVLTMQLIRKDPDGGFLNEGLMIRHCSRDVIENSYGFP